METIVQTTGKIMGMTLESRVLVGEVVEFKEKVELGKTTPIPSDLLPSKLLPGHQLLAPCVGRYYGKVA